MNFLLIVFFVFAVILVGASILVVTVRNPVKAALYLVLAFFSAACIWLTLEAEFLAITLVLVYVGAVMVLFLFVIMMLDIDLAQMRAGFVRYMPLGLIVGVAMAGELVLVVLAGEFDLDAVPRPGGHDAQYSNTRELGRVIYTDYVFAFEVAALILLVAIIAAITLTLRRRPETRYQRPQQQVRVRKEDRLRIVQMPSAGEGEE
ncbi:MAG TPA: NADH-quinone oxidoreductase subunit J [Gammaproteobacteria bacterium]|jgi:NADH-quinone oxidoreductase subunit J|nr:NADH:ubiquinone oxidoreductase subunit J [Acidiferrobacteraceae bacterium]MDP6140035.1 NADH-quinone oxidoreductase subunit J [Arenicellales bacterium]HCV20803.1 NADH-quinone oxidoreductase subunit J [Gammaproteobacteria bacterium]MDP6312896.1 NADH-quinone oxidoreductase subunit J [Arenicellales bacterium]MDP7120526.1 NADH-quinone oxidoreductase subunit J [Arenicellales bacterium]|tara:strand:- start:911 stop:1522 length:612 start_codon:yes stop_codon:yes gene_type:complete